MSSLRLCTLPTYLGPKLNFGLEASSKQIIYFLYTNIKFLKQFFIFDTVFKKISKKIKNITIFFKKIEFSKF
jgi:hypothetical protein